MTDWGPEVPAGQEAKDAYVLALETVEEPLLEQRARIAAEMEAARGALKENDFRDSSITARSSKSGGATGRALPREDRANYGVKKPSSEMEEHKRKRFRRRLIKYTSAGGRAALP